MSLLLTRRNHHHYTTVEYSPFSTEIEDPKIGLLQACRELGVAVVAYSPLSRGLLSGQIRSPDDFEPGGVRRFYPRFSAENFPRNRVVVEALERIAAARGKKGGKEGGRCSAGQLALAWLLSQGDDIFPIPGYVLF